MFVDLSESHLLSQLPWIDGPVLWTYDIRWERPREVLISDAQRVSIVAGRNNLFAAVHRFDDGALHVTAHEIPAPDNAVARIVLRGGAPKLEGDDTVWEHLPRSYFVGALQPGHQARVLFVDHVTRTVQLQQPGSLGSSGQRPTRELAGVTDIPGQRQVILSFQADSTLILYDPESGKRSAVLPLADRFRKPAMATSQREPQLRWRKLGAEVWAVDFDTLVRLDAQDLKVKGVLPLAQHDFGRVNYLGDFSFRPDEFVCAVARPSSGDVVLVDCWSFERVGVVKLGGEPIETALLSDGRVFARDARTGRLLAALV